MVICAEKHWMEYVGDCKLSSNSNIYWELYVCDICVVNRRLWSTKYKRREKSNPNSKGNKMTNCMITSDFNEWVKMTELWYSSDGYNSRCDLIEPYKDLIKNFCIAPTCVYIDKPHTPESHGFIDNDELIKFIETSHQYIIPFMIYDIEPTKDYNYTLVMRYVNLDKV